MTKNSTFGFAADAEARTVAKELEWTQDRKKYLLEASLSANITSKER